MRGLRSRLSRESKQGMSKGVITSKLPEPLTLQTLSPTHLKHSGYQPPARQHIVTKSSKKFNHPARKLLICVQCSHINQRSQPHHFVTDFILNCPKIG
jgi:hypothetical protein